MSITDSFASCAAKAFGFGVKTVEVGTNTLDVFTKVYKKAIIWLPFAQSTIQFVGDSYVLGCKIKLYARKPQLTSGEKAELVLDGVCTATQLIHLSMLWQEANNSKKIEKVKGLSDKVAQERELEALKKQREEILKTQRVLQGVLGSAGVSRDLVKGKELKDSILDNVHNLALFFETCEKLHKGTEKAKRFKRAREFIALGGPQHTYDALKYMVPKIQGLFSNVEQQPNAEDLFEAFEDMQVPEQDARYDREIRMALELSLEGNNRLEDEILREVLERSRIER